MFLAILRPDLGVMHTWEHSGLWSGIFDQKQSLGIASAILVVFSLNLFLRTKEKIFLFQIGLGMITAVGSGSRGAVVLLITGMMCSMLAWSVRSILARKTVSWFPFILFLTASAGIVIFLVEGHFRLFGSDVTINSRTLIWHYGITFWRAVPLLGTGLEFWAAGDHSRQFVETFGWEVERGWVLDDFHNGYVTVLVETGVIGYLLLSVVTIRLCTKLSTVPIGRFEFSIVMTFMLMFYLIAFSETYFFRSTNFLQATFLFLLLKTASGQNRKSSIFAVPLSRFKLQQWVDLNEKPMQSIKN